MQAHGASAAGEIFWCIAIAICLYMGLTLKSKTITQGGKQPINAHGRPLLYWAIQATLATLVILLLVIGWQLSTHHPVFIHSGGGD